MTQRTEWILRVNVVVAGKRNAPVHLVPDFRGAPAAHEQFRNQVAHLQDLVPLSVYPRPPVGDRSDPASVGDGDRL